MDETIHCYEFENHPYPVAIFFCANEVAWDHLLSEKGINPEPYPDAAAQVTTWRHDGVPRTFMAITISHQAEELDPLIVFGVIVHELVHVKQFAEKAIFGDNSGNTSNRLDDESEAYLMQKLIMWVASRYAESGRKFKEDRGA